MHSFIKYSEGDSDSNASHPSFEGRISDVIPSTCGGGRRRRSINSVLSRHNYSASPFVTPRKESAAKENQYPPKIFPSTTRTNNNIFNTTPKTTGQVSAEKSRINLVAANKQEQTPPNRTYSPFSEDSEIRQLRLKIQNHPHPGDAATKLEKLINLPWRVVFGPPESRITSSRELEVQRAGSSYKHVYNPLNKDYEADLPLRRDTPQFGNYSNQQNLNGQKYQQKQGYQQTVGIPIQTTTTTTKQQNLPNISFRHDKQIQTDDILENNGNRPTFEKFKNNCNNNLHRSASLLSSSSSQKMSTLNSKFKPRSYLPSLSPLGYQRPPPLPPPINVDSWALGPRYYRRIYLEGLVKRIGENETNQAKLSAYWKRYDEKSILEVKELGLLNSEHKLDARRRQFEEHLLEQDELEKNSFITNNNLTRDRLPSPVAPRPPTSILKKKTLPTTRATAGANSRVELPRVAFSSPSVRSEDHRRVDYTIKWQSNQNQLKKAKRTNSRINLKSNPTSIFQHIPTSSSSNITRR